MKNAWINQQQGPWSLNETMLSFEIYSLASRIPLFGGTTTITMGDDIRIASVLLFPSFPVDHKMLTSVSFTPVKWVNVQYFKTLPHACPVQNKMRMSWMKGHYCCLHFALLISLHTKQLPIAYFPPVFVLQAELLLIFTQRNVLLGVILHWYWVDKGFFLSTCDSCFPFPWITAVVFCFFE